ncbi:histidine phosphatase family protein [Pigmentiphaga sp.]|uniref:histidine phosphatase family protein n=1 Tax=Pigmentiphaga sp. TaxID=1977564 RepID=UPI00128BAA99|nr:histidine phosphatase family protein [Pigmentiphaga sp.]MPS27656.1 histidine phosphatase family protein [Alcaligenaceae bacterium SAGV5]MPS50683.1 histidine phosphatase family protein [Alcaligenaceae bacterium SAGV3]MPT56122.1 histidine phosphatase family protein [Alcaligenaceae bacterium]
MAQGERWLIRHGQSTANAGAPTSEVGASPLTALGREQAQRAARQVDRGPDLLIVSPFLRAQETAAPILERWPGTPMQVWPIQEFTYLSAIKCAGLTVHERRPLADAYWQRADPGYRDGDDAESFAGFADRLRAFDERLRALRGFIVAVGHGQFFHAYQLALARGLETTPQWMRRFRETDLASPIGNGQIVRIEATAHALR